MQGPQPPPLNRLRIRRRALGLGAAVLVLAGSTASVTHQGPQGLSLPQAQMLEASRQAALASSRALQGMEKASDDTRHIARWVFHSGDHGRRAVVIVDKKAAQIYVFTQDGRLQGTAPVLLGSAIGDHTVPGVGDKPIAQVLPAERTTPAGRFIAEPGTNANGEDVVWVDYQAAVSIHRVRAQVKAERRLERLASGTPLDNRISYGCINLPAAFYEKVLSAAVRKTGAVVYVLPETQPAQQFFGAYER